MDRPFDVQQILGPANEAQGNEVHAQVQGEGEVLPVLLGEGGLGDVDPRQVDPLVVGEFAPVDDDADGAGVGGLLGAELHLPIREQDGVAGLDVIAEALVGGGDDAIVPDLLRGPYGDPVTIPEGERAALELPDADLGALEVREHRHRLPRLSGGGAKQLELPLMGLPGPVGEVEPGDAHARPDQLDEHGAIERCRSHGRHDLGPTHVGPPSRLR